MEGVGIDGFWHTSYSVVYSVATIVLQCGMVCRGLWAADSAGTLGLCCGSVIPVKFSTCKNLNQLTSPANLLSKASSRSSVCHFSSLIVTLAGRSRSKLWSAAYSMISAQKFRARFASSNNAGSLNQSREPLSVVGERSPAASTSSIPCRSPSRTIVACQLLCRGCCV